MHAAISLHHRRHYSSTRTMLLKFCFADSEILRFVWKQTDLTKTCSTGSNDKKLSGSGHKTSNLVKSYCIPQKEMWSATKCHKRVTKACQSRVVEGKIVEIDHWDPESRLARPQGATVITCYE